MPTLDITDVSKRYGNIVALESVSLHVEDKEYVCVIGPSGCGKSTLIKCVAGIIQPDRGEILIDGRPINRTSIEDRRIGYVFQDIALFPSLPRELLIDLAQLEMGELESSGPLSV